MVNVPRVHVCVIAACFLLAISPFSASQETLEADQVFVRFSQAWDEDSWLPEGDSRRSAYMRPDDDMGWKSRMNALQAIASLRPTELAEVRRVLKEGSVPARMLAAQALGFTSHDECCDDLCHAAQHDPEAGVRLYAVDSLSMLSGQEHAALFQQLEQSEENRDVRRHLTYALERDDTPISKPLREVLRRWDPQRLNSARLGCPAPDFELHDVSGEKVMLSDFRGRKAVILVFVYGDT